VKRYRGGFAIVAAAVALGVSSPARADGGEANASNAQTEITNVDREAGAVQSAVERSKAQKLSAEQRLANGDLLYRSKDYQRAIVVFSELLEEFPPTTVSYPDALWLRGETYYATKEYLSARRDYRALVEQSSQPRFSPYLGRSLARLVDVCLRIGDIKSLDEVFAKLSQVPPAQVDAALVYAKGKAHFARKNWGEAKAAFESVPMGTEYTHQAKYFLGLVSMRTTAPSLTADGKPSTAPTNYKPAIELFRQVTDLPADSDAHKQVIDLSFMAMGRLFYEMENYVQASEAYARVGRESSEFGTMLYELAWVYVRLGDVQRAERALEVLQVADPGSPLVGDASLLRGDLLLRAGAFDRALQLYLSVKEQFDPIRVKVEDFVDKTPDDKTFYDKLSQAQLDALDQNDQIPSIAVRWAREAEDGTLAFAVIDDVNQCKSMLRQSYSLIDKLGVIVNAANRVRAFPELLAGEESALGLLNRLSKARLDVARGLDREEPAQLSGEIAQVREQRRQLMGAIDGLPINSAGFTARETQGTKAWNLVSQDLSRQVLQLDQMQATINGLRRMLKEDAQRGIARDATTIRRFTDELDANERDLKQRNKEVAELRQLIDAGRGQVGLGDARYQNDAVARSQFRDVLDREIMLLGQGKGGAQAQRYAERVKPSLQQARQVEDRLITAFNALEAEVEKRVLGLRQQVDAERVKINTYNAQLALLDDEAKALVGQVARRNFGIVRDRLRGMVLRADVGITEQAWEVREEELERVHNLQTERAREEQLLDEELREVLDDSGGGR
jgi:tetratricopeptide (TPR) repeat protein